MKKLILKKKTASYTILAKSSKRITAVPYEAEVQQRWGHTEAYREYQSKPTTRSHADTAKAAAEMDAVFAALARCLERRLCPETAEAQALIGQLQRHITQHYYTCTVEILADLGEMYLSDERFRANIDRHAVGTAAFTAEAIRIYCKGGNLNA